METRGNKYIKIIGAILIVALIGFFVKSFTNPSARSPTGAAVVENILSQAEPPIENPSIPTEIRDKNNFQEVFLSWGILNYKPKVIRVKKDVPVRITADTKRLTGCYRSFIIDEFNIKKSFNEKNRVLEFIPDKLGEYTFGCAMGMGNGKFIVE